MRPKSHTDSKIPSKFTPSSNFYYDRFHMQKESIIIFPELIVYENYAFMYRYNNILDRHTDAHEQKRGTISTAATFCGIWNWTQNNVLNV